ncbi:fatty acid-binding protein DegV [Paenibacillus sp. FSL R7-0273]|uniref:DegV family protein n=1 Tax=Paenibacillus sp. FSL R7-0273 TaxID=1536772 RepID=UPI0004F81862|nr:DegV family protein [Paenibacillus sp. FSL R7-0273]AIQ47736.1 fatty acid-binding protein DegV [Paenibacillus sp. FSL R7-0273]OMF94710.1 fatty acid-binding protein DegV [Paenibacillus sp. FSL R7-0273]
MKSIAWVTDSTSTIDSEFAKNNHVYIIPLRLIIDNECYKENIDISADQFYEKMRKSDKAGSSQPPIGEFVELYERLKEEYDEIIAIHCSSELSGTFHTSMQAADIAGVDVIGIDSRVGAYPIREMIRRGVHWQQAGCSALEIKDRIGDMIKEMSFYLIPASLSQLHRSGRLSGSQLLLGQLMRIHLLLKFDEGKIVVVDKIRTYKKTKQVLLETLRKDIRQIQDICIMHANNIEEALSLESVIKEISPSIRTEIMTFVPVVGVHMGEGTLALSWINSTAVNSITAPDMEMEPAH